MTEPGPAKMVINVGLTEDRSQMILQLEEAGFALGHIKYDAPEIETLLRHIARARSEMAETVPSEIDPGARIQSIIDPDWITRIPVDAPLAGVLLAIRHPGLGWLGNLLPPHDARNLGRSLLELSAEQLSKA
jgi:hypothetical protein